MEIRTMLLEAEELQKAEKSRTDLSMISAEIAWHC